MTARSSYRNDYVLGVSVFEPAWTGEEFMLGEGFELLCCEDVIDVFGFKPILVELPELIVVDLVDLPHVEDSKLEERVLEEAEGVLVGDIDCQFETEGVEQLGLVRV